jgi:hypothetical protein
MSDDSHDAGGPDRVAIEAVKANGRSSTNQAGPPPTDCRATNHSGKTPFRVSSHDSAVRLILRTVKMRFRKKETFDANLDCAIHEQFAGRSRNCAGAYRALTRLSQSGTTTASLYPFFSFD